MEEIISDVNATPEQTVDAQPMETTDNVIEEVVTPTVEKPVQTPVENAHFAEQRRAREAAEAKAKELERDYNISKTYGEYGVHSEADIKEKYGLDFEGFIEELKLQEMKDKGIDTDVLKQYADELPEVKAARELLKKQEEEQKKSADLTDFIEHFPGVKGEDIPPIVWETNAKGVPLRYAYADYLVSQQKEIETKNKANEDNAASSMGDIKGSAIEDTTLTEEMVENMTPQELMKHWGKAKKLFNMK